MQPKGMIGVPARHGADAVRRQELALVQHPPEDRAQPWRAHHREEAAIGLAHARDGRGISYQVAAIAKEPLEPPAKTR